VAVFNDTDDEEEDEDEDEREPKGAKNNDVIGFDEDF